MRAFCATLLLLLLIGPAQAEPLSIGSIKTVQGAAAVIRDGTEIPAAIGVAVQQNDVLRTGSDGSLGITFRDETMMSIGPNTEISLDRYAFAPEENKYSLVARITRGTLFYVSGLIAKLSPKSASVVTPGGTIGVRGTRFVVRVKEG